jgi:3-hydroxyacyl-[acyl-carrier-protein] dehydratase
MSMSESDARLPDAVAPPLVAPCAARLAVAAPLQVVDRVDVTTDGERLTVVATRTIDADDPHLRAHFPQFSIFPGVFILEGVRQAVQLALPGVDTSVLVVRSIRFLAPFLPGDEMTLSASVMPMANGALEVDARALTGTGAVAARLKVAFGAMAGDRPPDHTRVRTFLPHAHPMLLVDRVVALEPGSSMTAIKAVTGTEPCFRALAADLPAACYAYPTALVLESFGQAGAILWMETAAVRGRRPEDLVILVGARNCRVEGCAYPGDVLRHVVHLEYALGDTVIVSGETWVDDRRIALIESMTAVVRTHAALTKDAAVPAATPDHTIQA